MKRLLLAVVALTMMAGVAQAKIKVMLLDGASVEAYHNWRLGSLVMMRELD